MLVLSCNLNEIFTVGDYKMWMDYDDQIGLNWEHPMRIFTIKPPNEPSFKTKIHQHPYQLFDGVTVTMGKRREGVKTAQVRLAFDAPRSVSIHRKMEIGDKIARESHKAEVRRRQIENSKPKTVKIKHKKRLTLQRD